MARLLLVNVGPPRDIEWRVGTVPGWIRNHLADAEEAPP